MSGTEDPPPEIVSGVHAARDGTPRACVACGYNLYGLGSELRCPECGLRNIPEGLRRQVWDFVDSRRWFYSGMLRPFAKRPPGWWWALDREGDLRQSFRIAIRNVVVAALIILPVVVLADAVRIERTYPQNDYRHPDLGVGELMDYGDEVFVWGLLGRHCGDRYVNYDEPIHRTAPRAPTHRVVFEMSANLVPFGMGALVWAAVVWLGPALVGLWTQIRKGLPTFARAPRTIIAASMLESHRVIYLAVLIALSLCVETFVRTRVISKALAPDPMIMAVLVPALVLGMIVFGAAGWVGPLRSDYTRQLVRSRFHAGRIVAMYALFLPWVFVLAWMIVAAFVWYLLTGESM